MHLKTYLTIGQLALMQNPNLSLGKRTDLDSNKFVEFCKSAIKDGASFVGGCCEINHNHIKALSNEL